MAEHNELGRLGEEMAQKYLRKKGYKIVACNWKLGDYEIDIIAQTKDTLVFVEVKTRRGDTIQRPEEAVDAKRRQRLARATHAYTKGCNWQGRTQIDIIAIVHNAERIEINHIENAVAPRSRYY